MNIEIDLSEYNELDVPQIGGVDIKKIVLQHYTYGGYRLHESVKDIATALVSAVADMSTITYSDIGAITTEVIFTNSVLRHLSWLDTRVSSALNTPFFEEIKCVDYSDLSKVKFEVI